MKKSNEALNVLVAILPDVKDWKLLHEQLWYRIPVDTAPNIIKDNQAEYVAFYHTAKFSADLKWKVVKYAKIERMTVVSRHDLFPDEPLNGYKSHKKYYKIEFEKLEELAQPIVSRRGHRFPFFSTTDKKLLSGTTDLNRLFKGSPLEEAMAVMIDAMEVEYEREWREYVNGDTKFYYLDFAIFCTKANINVECDGDEFHMPYDAVYKDKTRNNELESYQWKILRYTTKHFLTNQEHIKKTLYKTLCSGDAKNDIQFPNFQISAKHKAKSFSLEEIQNLFYAIDYSKKGAVNLDDVKLIVLPNGDNLTSKDYENFASNANESVVDRKNTQVDILFSWFDEETEMESVVTRFDMIFSKKGGATSPDIDLIELSGIKKSSLQEIKNRVANIQRELYDKRQNELRTSKELNMLSINWSFKNIFASVCVIFCTTDFLIRP